MGMLLRQYHAEPDVATDSFESLTDEQLAEAYATIVGGRATKRESQLEALEAAYAADEDPEAEPAEDN